MQNLYIIGNGFDIAHKLPTRMEDFKNFLCDKYGIDYDTDSEPPFDIDYDPRRGRSYGDTARLCSYLLNQACIDEHWSDFERALGVLDYGVFFEDFSLDEPWESANDNETRGAALRDCIPHIKEIFSDWIKTINIASVTQNPLFKQNLCPDSDLFLTFNYTKTLEKIYRCHNVCHIHGTQCGEDILVGHGNDNTGMDDDPPLYTAGADDDIYHIEEKLRKDTEDALLTHQEFFDGLEDVESVYSIGFSYNDVDRCYIQRICTVSGSKISKWVLNDYDDNQICNFIRVVRECGFKGDVKKQKLI